ncbi:MAG TPA: trypsin-like serine protease [Candidatus Limnocylindria bacterium]|nr:trypsin-like serine protease [Candidatus Limnocylindria bacterium]
MRRLFFAVLAALMLATATPAAAITYGQLDNGAHPQVGLVVFLDAGNHPLWRCSGTLMSATVLLTAGHCTGTDGTVSPAHAIVWFTDHVTVGTGGNPSDLCNTGRVGYPCNGGATGTPHPHPQWTGALTLPNTHDVGVVVLDSAVSATYGTLPPLGFLDGLATRRGLQDTNLTRVGYGLQEVKPNLSGLRTRFEASQQIKDLRSALTDGFNVGTTNAPGNGLGDGFVQPGGACFGDSGGPAFYAQTLTVVGITSFVLNLNCKGGDYSFRTDTSVVQDFLAGFGITAP